MKTGLNRVYSRMSPIRFFAEPAEGGAGGNGGVESDPGDSDEPDEGAEGESDTEADDEGDDESVEGEDRLGDPGKKALDTMKAKLRAERTRRREAEAKLNQDAQTDERIAKANQRILKSEIKAAAKGKLSDPADAFRFLDLDQFEVSEDGEVDEDEIAEAITDLITRKPYLGAQGARFQGDGGGGARTGSGPRQLTQSDLDRMTPEQILAAKDKGQLRKLLGTK